MPFDSFLRTKCRAKQETVAYLLAYFYCVYKLYYEVYSLRAIVSLLGIEPRYLV